MAKKLTYTDIQKENKLYEKKKKVILTEDLYVNIYPNFAPVKISELVQETLTDPQKAKDVGIDFDKINLGDWQLFNIICKFTDLGIPSDDIKNKVRAFNEIMNSEYWTKIMESFPKESLDKIENAFSIFTENIELLLKNEDIDIKSLLEGGEKIINQES